MINTKIQIDFSDYKEHFIAFLDIIGFEEKINKIENDVNKFKEVASLLEMIKVEEAITNKVGNDTTSLLSGLHVTSVSDSIIITVPFNAPCAAMKFIQKIHLIQYAILIKFQCLLRGSIKMGMLYHKNGVIFGKPYILAYESEKVAKYPRVIIDSEIIDYAKEVASKRKNEKLKSIFDYLTQDKDKNYFVDYFKRGGDIRTTLCNKKQLVKERALIDAFIQSNKKLYKEEIPILEKYKWLEKYFNKSACYFDL